VFKREREEAIERDQLRLSIPVLSCYRFQKLLTEKTPNNILWKWG